MKWRYVSPSTVSRYLNGQLKVSPATEAKVLDAVAELGYVPNAAGRNLAVLLDHTGRLPEAEAAYTQARKLLESLVTGFPNVTE